ncbi:thiol reductase thioredoxin [Parazoarcus communis]|uniref:Thiol reductase thioredoxin n=1 Tax=Parazoarcus communis TaxID=41977 RepID=A0A2U8H3W7_9RHOO|nr:thioredoxin family protein [Parazoarcus communis]AWI80739.1 thiol reductase thioredoxin [Parazoarcus communis]
MPQNSPYQTSQLTRDEIDALDEAIVLDFGTDWCGHCNAAAPLVAAAMNGHAGVRHIKVEDGPGRRLGRSFGVKLWPSLIFVRKGQEIARLVRPGKQEDIEQALQALESAT